MPHLRMLATRHTYTWTTMFTFPGVFLPAIEAIDQGTRQRTSLLVSNRLQFGRHYAETLRRWDERFLAASEEVLALGFDERFLRMWHFYLEYSRAGFASGYLDVQQLTLTREDG
jgi:cyclopropane-fatty-acyl-phospholipid synthase